jgi:type I restriction enzyme M protein
MSQSDDGPAEESLQGVRTRLEDLKGLLMPLRADYNQLSRQFWVSKGEVKAHKYDLSASRYRQVENDEIFYEKPKVTLVRMALLEQVINEDIKELADAIDRQ